MAKNGIVELMKQGDAYRKNGEYEKAIEVYTKVIGIDPKYKKAYCNRGTAFLSQGKYGEAIADYTKAIEIDPKYKVAYNCRGATFFLQDKYVEAIADYTQVIRIDNQYKEAYCLRGILFKSQKKYGKAKIDFSKALEIDYEYKIAYRNLKDICKLTRNYTDSYYVATVKFYDKKFYDYIEKIEKNDIVKIKIYKLYTAVTELKDKLRHTDFEAVGHYTKIGNLKHLIKAKDDLKNNNQKSENGTIDTEKPKEGRLRLNNVSYMNDPTEGEVFLEILKKYNPDSKKLIDNLYTDKSKNVNDREVLSGKNHVFLVSFSSAIDTSLPMWVQYSENGEGCCLVFDSEFFDKEDKTSLSCSLGSETGQTGELLTADIEDKSTYKKDKPSYCLYKVKYVEGEKNGYKLDSQDEKKFSELIIEIGKQLAVFEEDLKKENKQDLEKKNKSVVRGIIQNILDQVRFLFKDKNYEHEEEVRLVKFEDNGNVKYTADAEGFRVPHVYIELEKEMKLKEVILGPKVQNAAEIANYLYYTEKVDEVSKSKIKYK